MGRAMRGECASQDGVGQLEFMERQRDSPPPAPSARGYESGDDQILITSRKAFGLDIARDGEFSRNAKDLAASSRDVNPWTSRASSAKRFRRTIKFAATSRRKTIRSLAAPCIRARSCTTRSDKSRAGCNNYRLGSELRRYARDPQTVRQERLVKRKGSRGGSKEKKELWKIVGKRVEKEREG